MHILRKSRKRMTRTPVLMHLSVPSSEMQRAPPFEETHQTCRSVFVAGVTQEEKNGEKAQDASDYAAGGISWNGS